MNEVRNVLDETFRKSHKKQRFDMMDLLNKLRCCPCGHRKRLRNALVAMTASVAPPLLSKMSTKRMVLITLGAVLGVVPILTVYLARKYNHYQSHGSSACVSSIFYTFTDCEVVF